MAALIFVGLFGPPLVAAGSPAAQDGDRLVVVTKVIEPFVMKNQGRFTGFSIDLWQELARSSEIQYEYLEVENVADQLAAVENGQADLGIAAISMTAGREEVLDFSHPYFSSGLQIMRPSDSSSFFRSLVAVVTSPLILGIVGSLLLIMLVMAHIVWLVERNENPDFPRGYLVGIWHSLWWTTVTMTTVGYGDTTPKRRLGQAVAMFWMFAGLVIVAGLTATIASQLTLEGLRADISTLGDLNGRTIVTVRNSTASEFLADHGIRHVVVDRIEEAYVMLENDTADGIVYDAPILLHYAASDGLGKVELVGDVFKPETYGIALPQDSPYRERLNRALLETLESGVYVEIYDRWFGERQ
jgi:ABC-type amino acid transport substrate-binding protein